MDDREKSLDQFFVINPAKPRRNFRVIGE